MTETTKELTTRAKERVKAVGIYRPEEGENAPSSLLAVILAAAADPRCDVSKMQALLNMQRDVEEREAKKDFTRAFIALQEALPSIGRDGKIEIRAKDAKGDRSGPVQQSTPYATFNNIMKIVKPLLKEHGFALSFSTEPSGERLLVKGLLEGHGHERTTSFPLPAETSGSKNNVQGWGSSMSYGKRYCTIALLNIVSEATDDADTDGHRGTFKHAKDGGLAEAVEQPKLSPASKAELEMVMQQCGVAPANFCTHYGIKETADLPQDLFESAKKALREHAAKKAAK